MSCLTIILHLNIISKKKQKQKLCEDKLVAV